MPELTSGAGALLMAAILGYLFGSIPFGVIVTRLLGLGDLRRIGSGNIGATNVLRTGNKPAALATLLLDGAKGGAAVLAARAFAGEDAAQLAGLAAFLGHLFPVWLKFRGGKGVATFLGTLLALAWPAGLAACATWLVTAIASRYSSLSALVAAALAAIWAGFLGYGHTVWVTVLMATFVYWKHLPNIERLKARTEPKIGAKE
ncbi:MAG: glycerol-3-phosphate 1-O-acyltransferase PlsY [Defluviimonas sp.]|uniref:glycerol-3-phosphate 1-O-acyltransferase PlsY n=1 Tax=Albidovulum sp. TaxID=1872424 RepID=UPI001D8A8F43|nr:glycerol-3-phosphate 1-O-acyltransferase PlsY [Paracoccaceae bacterium]MCC0065132.1 glycerol-3-phosphate 1-O-acyltransferase PlsY [Defluviimonas sp.]